MLDKVSKLYLDILEERLYWVGRYNDKFTNIVFHIDINDYLMRYLDGSGLSGYIPKSIYYGELRDRYYSRELTHYYIINLFKRLDLL